MGSLRKGEASERYGMDTRGKSGEERLCWAVGGDGAHGNREAGELRRVFRGKGERAVQEGLRHSCSNPFLPEEGEPEDGQGLVEECWVRWESDSLLSPSAGPTPPPSRAPAWEVLGSILQWDQAPFPWGDSYCRVRAAAGVWWGEVGMVTPQ